ncbi:MAG: hypothetical protein LBQ66_12810 [Planctomycetaceae bacterium]|nr:hypothetical protein [Planctomycetaceae bacterium]
MTLPLSASTPTLFTKKAWQSVTHLTITNAKKLIWYNEAVIHAFMLGF